MRRRKKWSLTPGARLSLGFAIAAALGMPSQGAQAQSMTAAELAKKTQNPISSMISLPFENTFNFKNGKSDQTQYVLQIQPVVPVAITGEWNLITRPIIPVISQPEVALLPLPPILVKSNGRTFGLGDINVSFFFSPNSEGDFTWGAGPVFLFPSATDNSLGAEKWAAGPTAVGLYQGSNWSAGGLVGQMWSYGGTSKRDDVNSMYLQPFVNYNLADGWYLSTSPILSANWEAKSGQEWTVPLGAGIGKIFALGSQQMNARLNSYYNVVRPDGAANWQLQFTLQFLFPR
jgi:hypothetical protein